MRSLCKYMWAVAAVLLVVPTLALAASGDGTGIAIAGIRVEFLIFAVTLACVAIFHHRAFESAVTGLIVVTIFKLVSGGFDIADHLGHEWRMLLNLFGLLMGFAILARHFEDSRVPAALPRILPLTWVGSFVLLAIVFALSAFLDNIAAAMIGGAMAHVVFRGKVHVGYLAAIVAASNAGGAGSVIGDTTTTMMWIDGVPATDVLHAFVGAVTALLIFGTIASRQQHLYQPIQGQPGEREAIDWAKLTIVGLILLGAIASNVLLDFPAAGVWAAILLGAIWRPTPWGELRKSLKGSVFLLSLVLMASMMPVESLPGAGWRTALGMGFLSSVFDNIPLTKLMLAQGGYDWGFVAFAVGFGGSITWFGSSAGVALCNMYPEGRSVASWLKNGWHIAVAYVAGFAVMMLVLGWHPHTPHH